MLAAIYGGVEERYAVSVSTNVEPESTDNSW
jgi:hypothetical protein